jgi:DNA-binding MarR family transcriptional regulator
MAEFMFLKKSKLRKERKYPMEIMDDDELYKRYRFDRAGLSYIIETFYEDLKKEAKGGGISPEIQIMATLQYLASNTFQLHIADAFSISQQSISNAIRSVVKAVSKRRNEFIKFPADKERRQTMRRFYEIVGFPQIVGLVDGTQIPI